MAWQLTYDDENQEDAFPDRPSEFVVRQAQRAAPDAWTRVYHDWELVEERPPLERAA